MAATVKFDVFYGLCVTVPAGTDPDTTAGMAVIAKAAAAEMRQRLDSGETVPDEVEPFPEDE